MKRNHFSKKGPKRTDQNRKEEEGIEEDATETGTLGLTFLLAFNSASQKQEEDSSEEKKPISIEESDFTLVKGSVGERIVESFGRKGSKLFDTICDLAADPTISAAFLNNPEFQKLLQEVPTEEEEETTEEISTTTTTTPPFLLDEEVENDCITIGKEERIQDLDVESKTSDVQTHSTPDNATPEGWIDKRLQYCQSCRSLFLKETDETKFSSGSVGSPPKDVSMDAKKILRVVVPLVCATLMGLVLIKYGKGIASCFKQSDLRDCGKLIILGAFEHFYLVGNSICTER